MSRPPCIAVVDDDPAIREALDDLFRSLGYSCRLFASAEAFLAFMPRAGIDCLLLDVQMPGMNGLDLQRVLNEQADKPPTLFMTSFNDGPTRERALAGGALGVLGKPVDDRELIDSLHRAMGR